MRARFWTVVLVLLALGALAMWRAGCVLAGPDIDTDAYAHHMIARAITADPGDLAVHWVWLPLFHYIQVPLVLAGGTMTAVRWVNVALCAAIPALLFFYVRGTARSADARVPPDATALVAALFAGGCPIVMQMGTTAQPEPLFALLLLGVAISFERRQHTAAAIMLSAAVMLRYEAWAALAAAAALLVIEEAVGRFRRRPRAAGRRGAWMVIAAPLALILAWAALRRPVDGRWFGFLVQTKEFANGALGEKGPLNRGIGALAHDLVYYPILVAGRVLGPVLALAPIGVVRTVRQQGPRFVLVFVAGLAFVSLSWVMRSSLGLDRHFVAIVPLYATFAAQGVAVAADWGVRVARRSLPEGGARVAGRSLACALAVLLLGGLAVELDVWMAQWRGSIARGWPDREALGDYLRTLPGKPTVFCDDATLEILSGIDRHRFDRHWVDDPHTWDLVGATVRDKGEAYVATWQRKLRGHESAGQVVFRAGGDPANPDATGVAVMRVAAEGVVPRPEASDPTRRAP
jgi:hypothetical protein